MNEGIQTNRLRESGSWSSWLNILLGIWVLFSPFVLAFELTKATWNNIVIGFVVGILALIRLSVPNQTGWSRINVLLGIWLVISPFALGFFRVDGLWNNVVLGIIIAAFSLGNASSRTSTLVYKI